MNLVKNISNFNGFIGRMCVVGRKVVSRTPTAASTMMKRSTKYSRWMGYGCFLLSRQKTSLPWLSVRKSAASHPPWFSSCCLCPFVPSSSTTFLAFFFSLPLNTRFVKQGRERQFLHVYNFAFDCSLSDYRISIYDFSLYTFISNVYNSEILCAVSME